MGKEHLQLGHHSAFKHVIWHQRPIITKYLNHSIRFIQRILI